MENINPLTGKRLSDFFDSELEKLRTEGVPTVGQYNEDCIYHLDASCRKNTEINLKSSEKERVVGYAKIAGWSTVPFLIYAGVAGLSHLVGELVSSYYGDKDLEHYVSGIIMVSIGGVVGGSGMTENYIRHFKDLVDHIRIGTEMIKDYRKEL